MSRTKRRLILLFVIFSTILIMILVFAAVILKNFENKGAGDSSLLVSVVESYYGDWEIVEDFGYQGVHRTIEIEKFEVGKKVLFYEDAISYEGNILVDYPKISIQIITSADMQAFDGMFAPGEMGFSVDDSFKKYAKVYVKKYLSPYSDNIFTFYILNNNEIIIIGDTHRYYRAIRG